MKNRSYKIILGISAYYHDSAASIVINGEIIAAAQEERFTRIKHDPRFPFNAINYCLEEAFIEAEEIDMIVFYDNPLLTYERIINNMIRFKSSDVDQFAEATKSILGLKLWVERDVKKAIGTLGKGSSVIFAGHHFSHAASAFFPSPYESAAILTIDGVGEWSTTTIGHGKGNDIKILNEINYPHSLGLLYSAFTFYCGFKVNSGEYKLMGLAPYGKPKYAALIYENLIDVKEDGSYRLNLDYFGYLNSERTTNEKFHQLFCGSPRQQESMITRKEMDLAASVQVVTEDIVKKLAKTALHITGENNLCLSGGVALNCVANGKLVKDLSYKNIWIQPAAGDAGGALGSALLGYYTVGGNERKLNTIGFDQQKGSYLGPAFKNEEILAYLEQNSYTYRLCKSEEEYFNLIASELVEGKVIGFFSGRMEFGPRSLGGRSIIGDARNVEMQSKMNRKIKYRESFRPFAPAVLKEDVDKIFDIEIESPYMLLVAPVRDELLIKREERYFEYDDMIKVINQQRSVLPAITHVDNSARIQTVDFQTNPRFYKLLQAFKAKTGYGVLVNTSFNVRGEPIVCSPKDAYTCFMRTEMDVLVLEDFILFKTDQPAFADNKNWMNEFQLD
jgi:carbamoyltransferase